MCLVVCSECPPSCKTNFHPILPKGWGSLACKWAPSFGEVQNSDFQVTNTTSHPALYIHEAQGVQKDDEMILYKPVIFHNLEVKKLRIRKRIIFVKSTRVIGKLKWNSDLMSLVKYIFLYKIIYLCNFILLTKFHNIHWDSWRYLDYRKTKDGIITKEKHRT